MPRGMYVTVEKDGKRFDHFVETPARGFQCFDNVRAIARRRTGGKVVGVGIYADDVSSWEPPEDPYNQSVAVKVPRARFAFGRKIVAKHVDFDMEFVDNQSMVSDQGDDIESN